MNQLLAITVLRDVDISNRAATAARRQLVAGTARHVKPMHAMRATINRAAITAG